MPPKILVVIGTALAACVSAWPQSAPQVPSFFECDSAQQCRQGSAGAWVFQGNQGSAVWLYGAFAKLTVTRFDGRNIAIHREDTPDSSSYRAGLDLSKVPGHLYIADYTGTISGNRIDGLIHWPGGGTQPWFAMIPEHMCSPVSECPEGIDAIMHLGAVALQSKHPNEALFCYRIGAAHGNADGQGLAGTLLLNGVGSAAPNPAEALPLLQASVEQNSYFGMYGLAHMYEEGIGTPRDPAQAALWKDRGDKRMQLLEAQENLRKQQMAAMWLAVMSAVFSGSGGGTATSDSLCDDLCKSQRGQEEERQRRWGEEGGSFTAPGGWHPGDPVH